MLRANKKGMTLIEVLIALAVLSIALTALVRATTMDIRDTDYLRDKTIASWVAMHGMSTIQLDLPTKYRAPATIERNTMMLGQQWFWTATLSKSPKASTDKIVISVSKRRGERPLIILDGFKSVSSA